MCIAARIVIHKLFWTIYYFMDPYCTGHSVYDLSKAYRNIITGTVKSYGGFVSTKCTVNHLICLYIENQNYNEILILLK